MRNMKRDDDEEYYEFDSDNNKKRISRSDALAYPYHVVCKCNPAKGWEHNKQWTENSDSLPMTESWDPTFKERFYSIHLELKVNMKQMIAANLDAIPSQ